ncbi:hypothetical protein FBULB1_1408 [Fusarium bulbicola]|nr:hypothetical protein FBULB1_1408 [Fusarium bulbicola]
MNGTDINRFLLLLNFPYLVIQARGSFCTSKVNEKHVSNRKSFLQELPENSQTSIWRTCWPGSVDCNNICVKVSYESRSICLLKTDSTGGAYDISYDAWNYLGFGKSASDSPREGGGIAMNCEFVHASECTDVLHNGKLPLTAADSMNYVASCLSEPNNWVAQNFELYNINDPIYKHGINDKCYLNLAIGNQPECPSGLGAVGELNLTVQNIQYRTGKIVPAQ